MIAESILCLALTMYHEARGEGPEGMTAVGTVVLNRVAHETWPDDICSVTNQPRQFAAHGPVHERDAWQTAKAIATDLLIGEANSVLDHRAVFFHAAHITPHWADDMDMLGRVGDHVFYALPGWIGPRPRARPTDLAPRTSLRPEARPT
jgi:spore germination cell wall hydrolase CwlJ-like protein